MTGSVPSETHGAQSAQAKKTGKSKSTAVKRTQQSSDSLSNTPKDSDKASKRFLPPLATSVSKASDSRRSRSSSRAFAAIAASPISSRKPPPFSRTSSIPAKNMDINASTLARRGRAQSFLTLYNGGGKHSAFDPIFNTDNGRGFEDSGGARSELNAPVSRRRREPRGYGTLERATSYSSLRPGAIFRSANSTRPPPAPPCTTTHLDYCRHPVNPANYRLNRRGTPRRNNPHPVGLHFQSPYNKDGKTFEVWNPDESIITNRLPQMCKHIEETNFSSGKMTVHTPERSGPPEVHYSHASVYRSSYRSPQGTPDCDGSLPTTRFGSTHNRAPAVGVVPNVMSLRTEWRVKLHIPRGHKLESLV